MYISANISYDSDEIKFRKRLEQLYHLGYQGAIVDLGQIEKIQEFKSKFYPGQKSPKISPPVTIQSLLLYKAEGIPLPIIPRITLRAQNPEQLKNILSQTISFKVLIAVESLSKEVLEVAARDGRVDIISVPTVDHQKILTKGILSLMRQSGCSLEISFIPLIDADHFKRTKLLRALYRLFLMAKPLSHTYVLGMNTVDPWLYRGPVEHLAILHTVFQVGEVFAKQIIRENAQELVLRYIKRDQDLFIEPGVEIVAEKRVPAQDSLSKPQKGEDSPVKYIRQRYVLFEYITEDNAPFDKDDILRAIWHQVISFFGEHTTFQAGLWMIRFDPIHKIGIIRMDNVTRLQVVAAMALIKNIKGRRITFHSRKTAGTIKKTLTLWKTYFASMPPPRESSGVWGSHNVIRNSTLIIN